MTTISYCFVESPLGRLRLDAHDGHLVGLRLPLERHPLTLTGAERPGDPLLRAAASQLAAYFAGTRVAFDLPLLPAGTEFQRLVWRALLEIPFGATRSYGELAGAIGRPRASRAVGAANGRNPIAIIIPCHRVIGSDGSLTGYGGGEPAKRWLLEHEARARAAVAP